MLHLKKIILLLIMLLTSATLYAQKDSQYAAKGNIRIMLTCADRKPTSIKNTSSRAPALAADCPIELYYNPSLRSLTFVSEVCESFTYTIYNEKNEEVLTDQSVETTLYSVYIPEMAESYHIEIHVGDYMYKGEF